MQKRHSKSKLIVGDIILGFSSSLYNLQNSESFPPEILNNYFLALSVDSATGNQNGHISPLAFYKESGSESFLAFCHWYFPKQSFNVWSWRTFHSDLFVWHPLLSYGFLNYLHFKRIHWRSEKAKGKEGWMIVKFRVSKANNSCL